MEKQEGYVPPKALGSVCAGGAPNAATPKGDPGCAAASAGAPPKTDGVLEAGAAEPPKPPNEKPPAGAAVAGWEPAKTEKPLPKGEPPLAALPNNGAPAADVVVEAAGTADLKLKAPKPLLLVVDDAVVAGVEPKTLPDGVEDAVTNPPPKGLVTGPELAKLGLAPNPDPVVVEDPKPVPKPPPLGAAVLVTGAPPKIPLEAAEVPPNSPLGAMVLVTGTPPKIPLAAVEVIGAAPPNTPLGAVVEILMSPNPAPNGLEVEAGGLAKGLALAADDMAVVVLPPNPLPNAPLVEVGAIANGPVLEINGPVAVVGLNTLPNGVGVELAAVALLPNTGAVADIVELLPNARVLAGLITEKPAPTLPMMGLEPKDVWPVDKTVFVVGEVDWTDVVMVEASDTGLLTPNGVDNAGRTLPDAVVVVGVANGAAWTDAAEALGVLIPSSADLTSGAATLDGVDCVNDVAGDELGCCSSVRMALSLDEATDVDCDKSVPPATFGLVCGTFIDASCALDCELGVAGVREIVGTVENTGLEGVWKLADELKGRLDDFVAVAVVVGTIGVVVAALGNEFDFGMVGVLFRPTVADLAADERGLVAAILENSRSCSGLAVPENKSMLVRT